jgi:hypothetical protein
MMLPQKQQDMSAFSLVRMRSLLMSRINKTNLLSFRLRTASTEESINEEERA